MKFKTITNAVIMAAFFFFTSQTVAKDLKEVLPLDKEISNWVLADSIGYFKGDQLYNYIDGGAEIYMEYGFSRVYSAPYIDGSDRQIQVELYEMADHAAAYGTYTFYLNGPGEKIHAGQEAVFIDYYGAVWKGNYVLMISTPGSDTSLKKDISLFAKNISDKINSTGDKPQLVSTIENGGLNTGYIKYFEGRIGLSNIYKIIPGNAFSFEKAVSFENQGNKTIIFQHESSLSSSDALKESLEKIKQSNKEADFTVNENSFSYIDYKNNIIICDSYKNYLIVVIGKNNEFIENTLKKVKAVL